MYVRIYGMHFFKYVTICKNLCTAFCFVPHFCSLPLDLCGKRRNTILQCFLPNVPQFVAFFRLGFERATLSPGAAKKINTFADFGATLRIAAHLQVQHNCGAAIAVQRTRLKVRRGMLCRVLKVSLWCICCVLFDAYRTIHKTFPYTCMHICNIYNLLNVRDTHHTYHTHTHTHHTHTTHTHHTHHTHTHTPHTHHIHTTHTPHTYHTHTPHTHHTHTHTPHTPHAHTHHTHTHTHTHHTHCPRRSW